MNRPRRIVASYARAEELVTAVRAVRGAGYGEWETYTPFEVEELEEIALERRSPVPLAMGIGGACSAAGAYAMMEYATHIYPINVGGRPLNSWPSFIPITFELTVLGASLTGLAALLIVAGLPRLHHAMFSVEGFERASQDRFFLCVEAAGERFDSGELPRLIEGTHPLSVEVQEAEAEP